MSVSFFIPGQPRPQGSKKAFAFKRRDGSLGANIVEDNPKTMAWRASVSSVAMTHRSSAPEFGSPIRLVLAFVVLRPKGHFGKNGLNKPGRDRPWPNKKPDVDKLERAVLDGFKGLMYHDDADVVSVAKDKLWTEGTPGVYVLIEHPARTTTVDDLVALYGMARSDGTVYRKSGAAEHGFDPLVEHPDYPPPSAPPPPQGSLFQGTG